jgi:hypothetical protein
MAFVQFTQPNDQPIVINTDRIVIRRDAAVKHQRVASRHPPTSASTGAVAARTSQRTLLERPLITTNVRFGSLADICGAISHVRFAPNSDRESGHPLQAMSALPWKADVCSATSNVGYGPIAEIGLFKNLIGARKQ